MANRIDHECTCESCVTDASGRVAKNHARINSVLSDLNEREARRVAGLIADSLGRGGVVELSRVTGMSRTTIARGQRELDETDEVPLGRARKPGGGRPTLEKKGRT